MLHLQIKAIYFCFNINTTCSHAGRRCYHSHISLYFNIKWKLISFPTKYQSNATHSWNITVEVLQKMFYFILLHWAFSGDFYFQTVTVLINHPNEKCGPILWSIFAYIRTSYGHKNTKNGLQIFGKQSFFGEHKSWEKTQMFCEQIFFFFSGTH